MACFTDPSPLSLQAQNSSTNEVVAIKKMNFSGKQAMEVSGEIGGKEGGKEGRKGGEGGGEELLIKL